VGASACICAVVYGRRTVLMSRYCEPDRATVGLLEQPRGLVGVGLDRVGELAEAVGGVARQRVDRVVAVRPVVHLGVAVVGGALVAAPGRRQAVADAAAGQLGARVERERLALGAAGGRGRLTAGVDGLRCVRAMRPGLAHDARAEVAGVRRRGRGQRQDQ
jgi:hypothetical protein